MKNNKKSNFLGLFIIGIITSYSAKNIELKKM